MAARKKSKTAGPKPDLRAPVGGKAITAGQLALWLGTHPDALKFVDEWLALRAKGETVWSLRDVLAALREHYNMPPFGDSGLRGWLEKHRSSAYRMSHPTWAGSTGE